jgi:hypothetical protein
VKRKSIAVAGSPLSITGIWDDLIFRGAKMTSGSGEKSAANAVVEKIVRITKNTMMYFMDDSFLFLEFSPLYRTKSIFRVSLPCPAFNVQK